MRNIRRQQVEHKNKRRRLVLLTFGILLFIYLSFSLIVGENGFLRYIKLMSTRDRLLKETMAIQKQNKEMRSQIEELEKKPELVEELARKYGLTKKGELVFKFEDKE